MTNSNIGFNTNYCSLPSNKNIQITYIPEADTLYYIYHLYKNDTLVRTVTINERRVSNIFLDATGKYYVKLERFLLDGTIQEETSCEYIVDKEKPALTVGKSVLTMTKGDTLDVMGEVTAIDNIDGTLTNYVITNIDELDLNSVGKKQLIYTVSDKAGNSVSKSVYINVTEDPAMLFIFQAFLVIFLMLITAYIIRYRRSLKLEKRVEKYSISSIIDDKLSAHDNIREFINRLINSFKPTFKKSVFLTKYSKKYKKYDEMFGLQEEMDFIIVKFITAFLLLFIAAVSKAIQLKLIGFYEIWLPLCIGFFLPDLLFIIKQKLHRKNLENDLLQAIVIMNNAFKSGRSITQAIYLVTTELNGTIAKEFKKMYMEINLGLGVEEVFRRFSERVRLEEVTYLTASLSIINKTGGNIIRVFDSIEKTLIDKKKLRLELASLTGGSKLIVNVLFVVPVLFVLFISILSPGYFAPLFTNPFGLLILVLILLCYIIYIICIKWILKVRM